VVRAVTHSEHNTGTDRVAQVAQRYPHMSAIANVQGDQPFVSAEMLTELVSPYPEGKSPDMTTLACPLDQETQLNVVKVLCDCNGRASTSRAPIPYYRNRVQSQCFTIWTVCLEAIFSEYAAYPYTTRTV